VEVKPLDTPVISAVPPPLTARLNPLIRFGLGLVAGVALAFLVEYLDPTVRTRADVQALGIAILAEVPSRNRR
jgi:capsular polysaccharide biosynthesis protein